MNRRKPGRSPRRMCTPGRRGVALVAALALLALASALVLGTFGAGRAMSRATATARAAVRADAGARRALAHVVAGWEGSLDSLAVGAVVARSLPEEGEGAPPLTVSATVRRLYDAVFLVVVDARVTNGSALIARRRYRWLVERSATSDSSNHRVVPSSLAGWSLDETN